MLMNSVLTFAAALPRRAALLGLPLLLLGCDANRVFEKNTDFDNYSWDVQQKPSFAFQIEDTTARYDVYFNVRNASAYGFYNLYVKHTLTGPAGPVGKPLLHEMILMDPKTGEPKGSGTGDIYDHQILALPKQRFARPGTYTLTLEQYMRQDQLPGLMAVGVRVARHSAEASK
jgi:gliding motility-associated lipoprotein GldH